jgi:3-dehydroquinate synthase
LHGEAIAIGMVCETFLSFLQCQLPQEEVAHISRYLLEIYGHHPIDLQRFDDYIALMQNDKKNEQGQINFSLLPRRVPWPSISTALQDGSYKVCSIIMIWLV